MPISIRTMTLDDVDIVAPIIARSFNTVNARYGYPSEFPDPSTSALLSRFYLGQDPEGCLVAEREAGICGSIFARHRASGVTIGPVSVDPACQGLGIGRRMVEAVCDAYADAPSFRLIQAAFNKESFSLYSRTGFVAVEAVLRLERPPDPAPSEGLDPRIRPATLEDLAALAALDQRLLGVERQPELGTLFAMGTLYVLDDGPGPQGYVAALPTPDPVFLGPAVARNEPELIALIRNAVAAVGDRTCTLHLPSRFASVIDQCYRLGFRLFSLETFMVRGRWQTPGATYTLSIFPEAH